MLRRVLVRQRQELSDAPPSGRHSRGARLSRMLLSEESVYGLILVSGMIVISNNIVGTSANALLTVVLTVVVFFAAHVYAGTVSRMAYGDTLDVRGSFRDAVRHSQGMLFIALIPVAVLTLGVARVFDDEVAIWAALFVDTLLLGALGWLTAMRWTDRFWPRLLNGVITAAFGVALIALKALIHH